MNKQLSSNELCNAALIGLSVLCLRGSITSEKEKCLCLKERFSPFLKKIKEKLSNGEKFTNQDLKEYDSFTLEYRNLNSKVEEIRKSIGEKE